MTTDPTQAPQPSPSRIFEAWLLRRDEGQAESFEELVARYPELGTKLQELRRAEELVRLGMEMGDPPSSASGRRLAPGKRIGDYRIVREIGRGGMGIVFEAEQISLKRRVALKVLPAQLTLSERALARFQREAEITGRLHHRGIIDIHQVGEEDGIHFFAMEFVDGTSLDRVIDRMRGEGFENVRKKRIADVVSAHGLEEPGGAPAAPAPEKPASKPSGRGSSRKKGSSSASSKNYIETAVKLVIQVAEALQHAHQAGVIHRDIKPANILVRPDGSAVVTDFGLAREEGLPSVSATGDFAGTAHYVAPEQAMAGRVRVDQRCDIFSLGATLYELLTLELAFPGENYHVVLSRILNKPPVAPQKHNPSLAPDLVTIILKALEKDPDRRYASAQALADDLRAFIEYRPIQARRTGLAARSWQWMRREPVKALLACLLILGLPLGAWGARELRASWKREAAERLPKLLDQGFLHLTTGDSAVALELFETCLATAAEARQSKAGEEAAAGMALALQALGRNDEAIALCRERAGRKERPLERLLAHALRDRDRSGDAEEAARIAGELGHPMTALEMYLEAVGRIHDRPFLTGIPARRLELEGGKSFIGWNAEAEQEGDALSRIRQQAREAIGLLGEAILRERRPPHFFAMAWAAWVAGDEDVARSYSLVIEEEWPESPVAWYFVGLAREVYDARASVQAFEQALRLDPGFTKARQAKAWAHIELDEFDEGLAILEELDREDPVGFGLSLAQAYLQAGRHDEAIVQARAVIGLLPEDPIPRDVLGCALAAQKRWPEARAAFQEAVDLGPELARRHNNLGWSALELGDSGAALAALEEARRRDPEDPGTAYNLGLFHARMNERKLAVENLEEALELIEAGNDSSVDEDIVHGALAEALGKLGRNDDAIAAFRRAIELGSDEPLHHLKLGSLLFQDSRYAESIEPLRRGLELLPTDAASHARLYEALIQEDRRAEALAAAIRWTDALPQDPHAWNQRAWVQVDPEQRDRPGDPAQALEAAERAVALSGGRALDILDTHACALFACDRIDAALEALVRAIEEGEARGAHPDEIRTLEGRLEAFEASR